MKPKKKGEGLEIIENAKEKKILFKYEEKQFYLLIDDFNMVMDIDKKAFESIIEKIDNITKL